MEFALARRVRYSGWLGGLIVCAAVVGCDPIDGRDDAFPGGKADDLSPAACAVLKLASTSSRSTLEDDVGLAAKPAKNIVDRRAGKDGKLDTGDDDPFRTMADLDEVPFVGEKVLDQLTAFAKAKDVACEKVPVQVLAFNDFHGNLTTEGSISTGPDPADSVAAGGIEFMATHIKQLSENNPNTVTVAAGDLIGASPLLSALFHDEPTIEAMAALGLDITAVGNHEFDEGRPELFRMIEGGCHPDDGCQDGDGFDGAPFEYLGANVIVESTGKTLLPPFAIRRFGYASVAFIGLTLEGTAKTTVGSAVEGLTFRDEAEAVNELVPLLKAKGVHAIVVLAHQGGKTSGGFNACEGLTGAIVDIDKQLDPAVDVLLSAHNHTAYNCKRDGRLVTSAASAGRLITDVDLVVDELTGEVVAKEADNVIVTRDVAKDPALTKIVGKYEALAAPLQNRIVGSITANITRTANTAGESAMGDLVADAHLEATRDSGAEICFMNSTGLRTDLLRETISGGEKVGEVTFGELFAVEPFGNTLVTLTLTGAQIEKLLEQQWRKLSDGTETAVILQPSASFTYTWDSTQPVGDRVDPASIEVDGEPLELTRKYRITVGDFLSEGGSGFSVFKEGTDRIGSANDIDADEMFLTARSPYTPPPRDRITRLD